MVSGRAAFQPTRSVCLSGQHGRLPAAGAMPRPPLPAPMCSPCPAARGGDAAAPARSPPQMKLREACGQGRDRRPRRGAGPAAAGRAGTSCPPLPTVCERFPLLTPATRRGTTGAMQRGPPQLAAPRQRPCPAPAAGTPWLRPRLPRPGPAGLPSGGSAGLPPPPRPVPRPRLRPCPPATT